MQLFMNRYFAVRVNTFNIFRNKQQIASNTGIEKKDKIGNINQAWKQIEKKLEKEKLPEKR